MTVEEALARLREIPSQAGGALLAEIVEGGPHRLALDGDRRPVLLLDEPAPRGRPRRIELPFVRIATQQEAEVVSATGARRPIRAAIVGCRSDDLGAQAYFAAVGAALVRRLASGVGGDLNDELDTIRDLFAAVTRPPAREAAGLWGELLLIHAAEEPEWIAEAWRIHAEDRYDFGGQGWRVEVKGYGGGAREHHVSHRQSWPPEGLAVYFASVPVERTQGGITVAELTEAVAARLVRRPDLALKVRAVVAATLGRGVLEEGPRFDPLVATQGLRFYRAEDVPRMPLELPQGVLDLRALVDFDDAARHADRLEDLGLRDDGKPFERPRVAT